MCGDKHKAPGGASRFRLKALKRAGMDYWEDLDVTTYINYEDFLRKIECQNLYGDNEGSKRIHRRIL